MRLKSFLALILILITFIPVQITSANGGFAVSGNFSSYHYKMVPGETISTPEVYVLFFNNYDFEIDVELSATITNLDGSPSVMGDRARFIIEETLVTIPADDTLRVSIGIELDEDAPGGDYLIGLSAEVIPDAVDGIAVTGSAELRTRLTVFGEAGDVFIRTFDMFGEALPASLTLYREDENGLSPVRTSENGTITDRMIPGTYVVIASFKNMEVAREEFELIDREISRVDLVAQTVFIDDMSVTPLLSEATGLLSRVRINYTLVNIHTAVEDVRLVLSTDFDDDFIYQGEEVSLPLLPEGEFEGSFNFLPPEGWNAGLYTFVLGAYQGNYLLEDAYFIGNSRERNLNVPEEYIGTPTPRPVDPEPEPDPDPEVEPDPDPDSEVEPDPEESFNWGVTGIIIAILAGVSVLVWFFVFYKKAPLDAVEYTKKVFKDKGFDLSSDHVNQILEAVRNHMHPGTDFEGETKGTDAYYAKVDAFLTQINAFIIAHEPTEEDPPDNPPN